MFEGRFMERIAPGAFTDSFASLTPKALFQHGRDPEVGDKVLGSPVTVREDDVGAAYEVPLFPSVPPLIVDGLRAGAYGASFRFSVTADDVVRKPGRSTHNPEGLSERTITKADVAEFGPVTFPAYAGATAGIRSMTDDFRPEDFSSQLDLMVRKHPRELAARLQAAMKGSEAEPTQPQPSRFRTREEYLQWLSKS
jgi:phage head maturation protease